MRTRTAITAGGLALVAALAAGGCGTLASNAAPTKVITVTAAPPNNATPAPATTTPVPSTEATAPSPEPAAPQQPQAPEVTDPWAVVSAYYGDIESSNFTEAWSLLSTGMQDRLGPFDGWAAGYACTSGDSVSENYASGDTVSVDITSSQCDGTSQFYSGTYTVDGGKITSASISQD